MFPIAGKTPGPSELNFFLDTDRLPGECYWLKNSIFFSTFLYNFFFTGNAGPFSWYIIRLKERLQVIDLKYRLQGSA